MMQSCASAAKRRRGRPILPFGMKAKGRLGIPPPRTVIGQGRNCRGACSVAWPRTGQARSVVGCVLLADTGGLASFNNRRFEATAGSSLSNRKRWHP